MNITYVSAALDQSGYAEAARNHIAALDSVGVNVNVVPISFERYRSNLGRLGAIVQGLAGKNPAGDIQILHLTPQNYLKYKDPNKYNIGYVAWETDRFPDDWVDLINQMNEMWVPSTHNKQALEDSGVVLPVHVMPHPFNAELSATTEHSTIGKVANLDDDDFVFYSIFQWIQRKGPIDLLRAYLTEFSAEENVTLVLKTYLVNPNNLGEGAKIREIIQEVKKKLYLKSYPKILLITSLLSRNQIRILHQQGDCYVSLHYCEGFGVPLAEAMLAKNPVIATKYGGPIDFARSQQLVKYTMSPVYGMPWSHYTGHMNWAQPDLLDARKKMRHLFENRDRAKAIGEAGYKEITSRLSWEKIGNRMKNRLQAIQKEIAA